MSCWDVSTNITHRVNPAVFTDGQTCPDKCIAPNQDAVAKLDVAAEPSSREDGAELADSAIMAHRRMDVNDRVVTHLSSSGNHRQRTNEDSRSKRGRGGNHRRRVNNRLGRPTCRFTGFLNSQSPDFVGDGGKVGNPTRIPLQPRAVFGSKAIRVEPEPFNSLPREFPRVDCRASRFSDFTGGPVSKDNQDGVAHTVPESTTNDCPVIELAAGLSKWQTMAATDSKSVGCRKAVR